MDDIQVINFLYKCRRCGRIDPAELIEHPEKKIEILGTGLDGLLRAIHGHRDGPFMHGIHDCADDGVGISDLIGCEPVKEAQ